MVRKVFLLGYPGSGKSTVVRRIETFARGKDRDTQYIYNYSRLYSKFQRGTTNGNPFEEDECLNVTVLIRRKRLSCPSE